MKDFLALMLKISAITSLVVLAVFLIAIIIGSMTHAEASAKPKGQRPGLQAPFLCC